MSYSKENMIKARETIAARLSAALADVNARRGETEAKIPELISISRELDATGARIMSAALSHTLSDEVFSDIRADNERLQAQRKELLIQKGYPPDYLDIKYTCPICSDTGYNGVNMCVCMKRELSRLGAESSGLAGLLDRQTFDSFDMGFYDGADRARIQANLALLRRFAEEFTDASHDSWLLMGATGLGKTHLSTAVAGVVIERGYDVIYESAQGLISAFEMRRFGGDYTYDRESRFYDCDLLIIDDLGTELTNQFTVSCIYNVINARTNKQRPTMINTNLTQGELRERYADRIASRLFGEFRPLLFSGRDVRGQKIRK